MSVEVKLGANPGCGVAVFALDGYRVWGTPDDPQRVAISLGGTEEEAHAAVVAVLHEKFCGDWTYAANLQREPPAVKPCGWCVRNDRYAH